MKKREMHPEFVTGLGILFAIGLATGAFIVNALADPVVTRAGILSDYFLRQYKYMEIDPSELFFYILGKRMKWVFLLWAAGLTSAGLPCAVLYVLWAGCSTGIFAGITVLKLGAQGLVFSAAALFPQALVYGPAWIFFLYGIYLRTRRGERRGYGLMTVGMCMFMIFGILLESSLNPWVVRQILRFL